MPMVCSIKMNDDFGTTEEFLRRFSIHSLDDLPSPNPEQVETFKEEAEEEVQLKLDI